MLINSRLMPRQALPRNPSLLAPSDIGTAYGVVLNVRRQVEQMGEAMTRAPYTAPARAPVLYIKTPNTYLGYGGLVPVPDGVEALEVNATLAVVFGQGAGRVSEGEALDHVAGYAIAIDVCIPHASLFRPAIRQRCGDGFLPIGPCITPRAAVADPDALEVSVSVDGAERSRFSTAELVRPVARLIADIAEFQTFAAGDVLLVGLPPDGPQARAGQSVSAEITGLGRLDCRLVAEAELDRLA